MHLHLQNVCPLPMQSSVATSEVWNTHLELAPGQRIQVNAPSGRGKTSLVHFLTGLRTDFTGEITLKNTDITTFSIRRWTTIRREKLSTVFQDLRLFPDLSVMQNLMLKAVLTDAAYEDQVRTLLGRLGLSGFEDRRTATLSQGEQQRVAICRALLQPCELLILDEPFSHLDPENIDAACQCIDEFCELRNCGLLMTSLGYDYPLKFDRKLKL
jgi:ABC-type lipoprotein export system ATPase subunit